MVWSFFFFSLTALEYVSKLVEVLEDVLDDDQETCAEIQKLEDKVWELEEKVRDLESLVDPSSSSGEAFCNRETYWATYEEPDSDD